MIGCSVNVEFCSIICNINSVLSLIQGSSNDSNSFDDSGSVSKSDSNSDAASDSALNWQSHSHPVTLMGLEVKL